MPTDSKISQLPDAGPLQPNDLLAIVQGDTTKVTNKISLSELITYSSSSTSSGAARINTTPSGLRSLISSGSLTPGALYAFDFQTKHLIPNTSVIHTGNVEELVVIALSSDSISNYGWSSSFSSDKLEIDLFDTTCEDGTTPRDGKITYRIDYSKNLETWYDFRNVVFRRWQIDTASNSSMQWQTSTSYSVGTGVYISNVFYRCIQSHYSGGSFNSIYWQPIFLVDTNYNLAFDISINLMGVNINANTSNYSDYLTFENSAAVNICIGRMADGSYNNIVFYGSGEIDGNHIGSNSKEMTFLNFASGNTIGEDCSNIIIANSSYQNVIGNYCRGLNLYNGAYCNTIQNNIDGLALFNTSYNHEIENGVYNITLYSVYGCNLLSGSNGNKIEYGANFSVIGKDSTGNVISNGSYSSRIGNYSNNNLINNSSSSVIIGNNCNQNTFNNSSYSNAIGDDSSSNLFTNSSYYNTLGASSTGNTFSSSSYNKIGNHSSQNTLSYFSYNTCGNNFDNNRTATFSTGNSQNNTFGCYFRFNELAGSNSGNTFGNYCSDNKLGYGSSYNTFSDNCSDNTFTSSPTSSSGTYNSNFLGPNCSNNILRGNNIFLSSGCTGNVLTGTVNVFLCPGLKNKTFNAGQDNFSINVADTAVKTYSSYFTNIVVDKRSPDGELWYSVINNSGSVTYQKIS